MSGIPQTLRALQDFPATLRAFLADVPAAALDWQPASWVGVPSEALTVRQQVCHVRDIEIDGYLVRFDRLLNETAPVLPSIDTDGLVLSRRYDEADLATALHDFEDARRKTITLLAGLPPAALARAGTFEGYGPVTVQGLIHYLCSHDQQHLAGIQWLAGQYASQPAEDAGPFLRGSSA
ncbi:MAG TPA: DinB family protein [Aliidongia sp.]|nr:DinB family protein [Aliidongia sp.]